MFKGGELGHMSLLNTNGKSYTNMRILTAPLHLTLSDLENNSEDQSDIF